jgi:SpoVK/Ycf46/Vps4 family AAA+-type ATPase
MGCSSSRGRHASADSDQVEQRALARDLLAAFKQDDYTFFCRAYLGADQADRLDYRKVHRFARNLAAYDLKAVGILLRNEPNLTTDRFVEALRSFGLTSNVHLGEVQQVTLADLKGVDDVIKSLEANVVVPLEQMELAEELHLKPKRGVLLVGPPGTGKTTVGRALAHRLKSKFFLIDGTYIVNVRSGDALRRRVRWRLSHRRGSHTDVPQHAPPPQAGAILA